MRPVRLAFSNRLALGLTALCVATQTQAELYKCRQPDGRISYQQAACAELADGQALSVDTRGPDGSTSGPTGQDYSVESQFRQMQAERQAAEMERERARRQAAAEAQRGQRTTGGERDPAKCAKQRAEVAKWKQKLLHGYRTRSEKDINENKLAHHQALADRYCD